MLSTYLSKRYCADKAFVIDSIGNISDEIDIVIYDRQLAVHSTPERCSISASRVRLRRHRSEAKPEQEEH